MVATVAVGLCVLFTLGLVWIVSQWLKTQFPQLARQALKEMGDDFLGLAAGKLAVEREKGIGDLEAKRQAIEQAVQGLTDQLAKYELLVKRFESDRDQKYGRLEGELKRVMEGADRLQQTTANLVAVLGNARVRGQWGQKMADDILRFCGLQEAIHFHREKEFLGGRPDYTFMLPDDHQLFMDVKFPLDNYLKLVGTTQEEEQRRYREAFIHDVREHLREMERRDYLAQSDHTVDYLLIFIPNEQVYGMVNELIPLLIDECLQRKMILCGPWTLYAVLRIIWQSWQSYHYTVAIADIVKSINGFLQEYGKFKERFEELGERLQKTTEKYQDVAGTSFRRLDTKIRQIEEYRKGQRIPEELPTGESITVGQMTQTGDEG